jgi:hypothetical protein
MASGGESRMGRYRSLSLDNSVIQLASLLAMPNGKPLSGGNYTLLWMLLPWMELAPNDQFA